MTHKEVSLPASAVVATNAAEIRNPAGRTGFMISATMMNVRENPVMNGVLYTSAAVSASDWVGVRATRGHPESFFNVSKIGIGQILSAKFDEDSGKLDADIFIDKEQAQANGAMDTYERLFEGEKMDVSVTVLITESQEVSGDVDGEKYRMKVLRVEPTSLGIMQDEKGACSKPYCGVNGEAADGDADNGEKKTGFVARAKDNFINFFQGGKTMSEGSNCPCGGLGAANADQSVALAKLTNSVEALNEKLAKNEADFEKRIENVLEKREAGEAAKLEAKNNFEKAVAEAVAKQLSEAGLNQPVGDGSGEFCVSATNNEVAQ